ncbi:MAG TPA: hypothetical protein VE684_08340 [Crenalkalicoccus sp.]|nr:hypothetical protein [Crenalkalicoccus sp.]
MDERAVAYNTQVERAENNLLLLNVLRAALHHPLYFTGFTDIHSPQSNTAGAGFSVPFAVQGQTGFFVSPTLAITENQAQFGLGVINSSEFTRGIATPVSVQTVDLFLQRGFAPEHLFSLFIARIETAGGDVFVNDPREGEAQSFQNLLRLLIALGLTTETVREAVELGPPLKPEQVNALERLTQLSDPNVALVRSGGLLQVVRYRTEPRFCFAMPPILPRPGQPPPPDAFIQRALRITCRNWVAGHLGVPLDLPGGPAEEAGAVRRYRALPEAVRTRPGDARLAAFAAEGFAAPLGLWPEAEATPRRRGERAGTVDLGLLSISLRSPEAIMLYLGDIVSTQMRDGPGRGPRYLTGGSYASIRDGTCAIPPADTVPACDDQHVFQIFRVLPGEGGERDLAAVRYLGTDYHIPSGADEVEGRSSETLSILADLFSLYRSASDLPRATPVRILPY